MARVLVVEDNLANQRLIRMLLESMGHTPTCAYTGEEGWALAQAGGFDLVLLDMHLPGIDGFELAGRVKRLYGAKLPIVAVTALAMDGDRDRVMESGCDGYVSKPISVPEFRKCLGDMLGGNGGAP